MNFDYCKIETAISDTERYILSESHKIGYDIEYDNIRSISEDMLEDVFHPQAPFNEGIGHNLWEAVKAIAKKLLKVLLAIWHSIVNGVKLIFNKIKEFFHGKEDTSTKISKPISLQVPLIENASVKEFKITSKDDLQKVITENIRKIANEINKRSRLQIEGSKKLISLIEKYSRSPVKEAKVLYNKVIDYQKSDLKELYAKPHNASVQGRDSLDTIIQRDPSKFEAEKMKILLNSRDIVHDYNEYCMNFSFKLSREKNADKMDTIEREIAETINEVDERLDDEYKNDTNTRLEILNCITKDYFNIPDDPILVKKVIHLKINYNKKLIQLLSEMVRINYQLLGLESGAIDNLIHGLETNSKESFNSVYNAIRKNMNSFRVNSGFYDFRKIARGIMYISDESDNVLASIIADPKNLVNLVMKYDCVLVTHGGDKIDGAESNSVRKQYQAEVKEIETKIHDLDIKMMHLSNDKMNLMLDGEDKNTEKTIKNLDAQIDAMDKDMQVYKKEKENIQKKYFKLLDNTLVKGWSCQEVKIGNHPYRKNVIDALDDIISDWKKSGQKYYRIFVCVCNPGNEKLPDRITKIPNLTIRMSHTALNVSSNTGILRSYQRSDDIGMDNSIKTQYGESYTFNSSKFSFLN